MHTPYVGMHAPIYMSVLLKRPHRDMIRIGIGSSREVFSSVLGVERSSGCCVLSRGSSLQTNGLEPGVY